SRSRFLESPVDRDHSVPPEAVGVCKPRRSHEAKFVRERYVEVLFSPLGEVRLGVATRDAIALHVRVQVFDHADALRPLCVDKRVRDDDETTWLERIQNRRVQLALLGMRGDVMKGERSDYGVAAGKRILKTRMSQLVSTLVRGASCPCNFEHVRVH